MSKWWYLQEFYWDVCHTPLWSNSFHFENQTEKILKLLVEDGHSKKEMTLKPRDKKLLTSKSGTLLLSAAFYKKEHVSEGAIFHRVAGLKDAPFEPEHSYYVFKRRWKMEADTTFSALPEHFENSLCTVETASSLKEALLEFDQQKGQSVSDGVKKEAIAGPVQLQDTRQAEAMSVIANESEQKITSQVVAEKAGSRGAALQVPNLPLAGMALDMTSDMGNASAANSAMLNIFPPPLGLAAEGMAPSMGGVAYVNASSQYPPRGMSLDPRGLPIGYQAPMVNASWVISPNPWVGQVMYAPLS